MTAVDDILAQIPLPALAAQLGVDEATAEAAARHTLPALLGGMEANARDPRGAESLSQALGQHDSRLVDGGVNLADVNTAEGQRIVSHVFGAQEDQVVSTLGGLGSLGSAGGSGLVAKLLPLLAPIVMSYLAKKTAGATGTQGGSGGLGGLGDILGNVLGGATGGSSAGGGLGDILGNLLGGGRR
jgi:hypothetical protein